MGAIDKSKEPLVSVIVPVYNVELYLEQCVNSIIRQKYNNLEIILIDDGSVDKSSLICDRFAEKDNRVLAIHKKNGGLSSARNAGLQCCQGEYVVFVDSDDWLGENFISEFMLKQPFDIAYGGCVKCYEETGRKEYSKISQEYYGEKKEICYPFMSEMVCSSLFGYSCAKIYNRKFIDTVIFENVLYREDLIFNLTLFDKAGVLYFSPSCDYFYRQQENSLLHKKFNGKILDVRTVTKRLMIKSSFWSRMETQKLSNFMMKTYIIDMISKCVLDNSMLSEREKQNEIKKIFKDSFIRKELKFYKEDCTLYKVFTICYKFCMPWVYYKVIKRKVNGYYE